MTLYFAYGSNMSRALMGGRCPGASPLGVATLAGWRFVLTPDGVGSIARCPGKLAYGTSGVGSAHHLSGELLSILAGVKMIHVPYKDSAQVVTETVAERIPLLFTVYGASAQQVQAGISVALIERFAGKTASLLVVAEAQLGERHVTDLPAVGRAVGKAS